jgi:hypothetical protein
MFTVQQVYSEAKKIIGNCNDERLFQILGDVVSLIANKGEFEGWRGWLDICTNGGLCVTLPREVETVLGVNLGGKPTMGYDSLFNFHLNGPGDCRSCDWAWQDQGKWHATYRDLLEPAKLVTYLQTDEDNNKELIVYGFDVQGNRLRRSENGEWLDGYRVPMVYGYAIPDSTAPLVGRITGIKKARTVGAVRLSTSDDGGTTGTLLGVYEPDETLPEYRRIKLFRSCSWVRIAYRKSNPVFFYRGNHITLKSRIGFLLGCQAWKYYRDGDLGAAHAYEADAARLEIEAQVISDPMLFSTPQVEDLNNPQDKRDYDIR